MSNFLVTGGCGFIGSHLVDHLVNLGHKVYVIDNLSTGYNENIAHHTQIEIYKADIERFDLSQIKELHGVFHLAAQASVPISIERFLESSSSNLLGTLNVLDYCTKRKIPFVYATSSAIYGNLEFGDEKGGIDLLSPYAVDKYCMELYADVLHKASGLNSFGLRFFNVYGPRQDASSPYSGVISIFIERLLNQQAITVNGGYQTRDFVFVGDVVKCLFMAYEHLAEKGGCEVANVLTGHSVSIDQLVADLADLIGFKPEITLKDLPFGDPERSEGSVKHMCEKLPVKVEEFIKFKEGLATTVEWYKHK
ncbi:MAG: NAD-dependent epimerase/dehydratase family protein [Bacteroidia bacterium]|jgi:UDP-glucose 4-epimerase